MMEERLDRIDPAAFAARRSLLSAALGGAPALLPAGRPPPRNYPANTYPFRASSHFLYLVGLPLEGAFALLEGERCTLFVVPPGDDDALWHGPSPSLAAIGARLGVEVRPRDELDASVRGRAVAHPPIVDAETRAEVAALLARTSGTDLDHALVEAIIALRLVHDEAAVTELRRAARLSVLAHRVGMAVTRPGRREAEVRAAMEAVFTAAQATPAYGSIVTTHGEVLHAASSHRVMRHGDLLLCDVGAETPAGFAGDVTRTLPVNGTFSATQRAVYEVVLAAQTTAIANVRPGVSYRDVHLAASRVIAEGLSELGILVGDVDSLVAEGAHALFFPHGIGHLLGLDVHDMEDLGDRAGYARGRVRSTQHGLSYLRLDRDLAPGMAVTIEPGFYVVPAILEHPSLARLVDRFVDRTALARFADVRGIRIEDDVLVTDDGADVLTGALARTPDDVEAHVGADPHASRE